MTRAAAGIALASALLGACEAPVSKAPSSPIAAQAAASASPEPPAASANATTVAPGFVALDASVVDAADTLDTLRARVGTDQVVAARVPGAEGEEFDGWHLHPGDPSRRLYVYLDESTGRPSMLRVLDRESRWQRSDGIRVGQSLAEIARRNGAPVKFLGFFWDYGGGISGWNGGTFEREPSLGAVQLCARDDETGDHPDFPMGDAEFDSTNAWAVANPPTVCAFSLVLEPRP